FSHSLILKVRGGTTLIFPIWKRLTFKRLILSKNDFRNLNAFFKDLPIDTHHGYVRRKKNFLNEFHSYSKWRNKKLPREDRHPRGRQLVRTN
ncbi:hypothetical protein SFRURICE_012921, partial [Spodoptera frugiperda]